MIQFDQVSFKYSPADRDVIQNLTLELEDGSFHFLCGASGAGKTTIFRMMYMDLLPTHGNLNIFGRQVSHLSKNEIALLRRKMGVVFQDGGLLNHLNVRENVSLPLTLHGKPSAEQEKCVDEIIDWVGLSDKKEAYPATLSGGEKQRVGIAKAVVNRPKLLIADEPSGNVDEAMAKRIMYLFTELNKHGTTVLVATHDKSLISAFDYPSLYLENGTITRSAKRWRAA
jgi:cell division transport system ATP-binding protein